MSGCIERNRSRLLGFPTSIAEASVAILGRTRSVPSAKKSGTVRLALCAKTIRSIGAPMRRAQRHAVAFPKLPLGMTNEAGPLPWRATARLAAT